MRGLPLILVVASGCGRIGFESHPAEDASEFIDGTVGIADAERVDAAPRIATGPFDTPTLIPELSDSLLDDDDPSLTADMLEIYFKRDTGTGTGIDIFVAIREDINDPWPTPVRADDLSSDVVDNTPEVSADGLTIHISSNRDGNVDIYRSTRPMRNVPWSVPSRVPELSSDDPDYAVTTDRAGLNLTMTRIVSGSTELFTATRATTAESWSSPVAAAELNSDRYEADSMLDETGLHIFYTTTTADGLDGRQLFTAKRPATTEPFGVAVPLEGVNTEDDDEDPWISSDLTTMYFVRKTAEGQDIYVATRPLDP